jgi:hypothetical protein
MKIALIGPGIMPIPPSGWGAVEILIWDYYMELTEQGHDVTIINTPSKANIIDQVNQGNFNFVHLHYDVFYDILDHLTCPNIAITSHYPYIDQPEKHRSDGYTSVFSFLINQQKYYNFVLATKDYNAFANAGANPRFLRKIKNGINSSLFRFTTKPSKNKTICLGKITSRKNQALLQSIPGIDFVGDNTDSRFNTRASNYLGPWTRDQIHDNLTQYVNLILLSEGEADPLVVKEALIAGLGVIVNRSSSENLDTTLDFISVIEDDKINYLDYIKDKIEENKSKVLIRRKEIREYGIQNFDIKQEVFKYVEIVESITQ